MHFNMNNAFGKVLASSVVALLATTSLYAIPRGPCEPKHEVCCEEPKPGPFAFSYPMDMNLSCPRDFNVRFEGLAFQAKEDGLEFAISDEDGSTAGLTNGHVKSFSNNNKDWDYNPGFRFGVGFYLDHDAWALDFCWTWVNITNYKNASGGVSGGTLVPLWILGTDTPAAQIGSTASASWKTNYNTIDIRLGKPYHVSRYVIFHPHFGIRGGWIDQHYSVDYSGTGTTNRTISHTDNDFWGFGARLGIDTDWQLGKGWCLWGNMASSILFGKFDINQRMTIPNDGDKVNVKYDYFQNTPNMELALGIGWNRHFNKGKYNVSAKIGYEFHEWWDQLNIRKFFSGTPDYANDVVSRGNLSLNGFSLKLKLEI